MIWEGGPGVNFCPICKEKLNVSAFKKKKRVFEGQSERRERREKGTEPIRLYEPGVPL